MSISDEPGPTRQRLAATLIEHMRFEIAKAIIGYHEDPETYLADARSIVESRAHLQRDE